MHWVFANARRFFSEIGILGDRLTAGRISTIADLREFVATRAAFVSQKTLFGYVQTRMGMEYSKAFQEKVFAQSLNIAKMHVFAACLSDLVIYTVAEALAGDQVDDGTRCAVARHCFRVAIDENMAFAPTLHWASDAVGEFDTRLADTIWHSGALTPENFTRSPLALVRWAPIAPELKRHDTEIVENSIKFAWLGVREDFRRRLDRDAVADDATR
ncbi:MAG: hypothetical protein HC861_00650 [Rhodospirillaceae bacterium]|nr:hypothetical protein [Rhodospirillaceae bacterium]